MQKLKTCVQVTSTLFSNKRARWKSGGIPKMALLYDARPYFSNVLDDVRRHLAFSHDSANWLEVTLMLLLSPPGIGKTQFARQVDQLLASAAFF